MKQTIEKIVKNEKTEGMIVEEGKKSITVKVPIAYYSFDGLRESYIRARTLMGLIERLPPKYKNVVKLYYGLEDGKNYSLKEVGKKVGVCGQRVNQILSKAERLVLVKAVPGLIPVKPVADNELYRNNLLFGEKYGCTSRYEKDHFIVTYPDKYKEIKTK